MCAIYLYNVTKKRAKLVMEKSHSKFPSHKRYISFSFSSFILLPVLKILSPTYLFFPCKSRFAFSFVVEFFSILKSFPKDSFLIFKDNKSTKNETWETPYFLQQYYSYAAFPPLPQWKGHRIRGGHHLLIWQAH